MFCNIRFQLGYGYGLLNCDQSHTWLSFTTKVQVLIFTVSASLNVVITCCFSVSSHTHSISVEYMAQQTFDRTQSLPNWLGSVPYLEYCGSLLAHLGWQGTSYSELGAISFWVQTWGTWHLSSLQVLQVHTVLRHPHILYSQPLVSLWDTASGHSQFLLLAVLLE